MSISLGSNRRKKIITVEQILESNRKMMGRPQITLADLGGARLDSSSPFPLISLGNRPKRYKTQEEMNKATVLANTASTELRRQVGENQSLTNFFDSSQYYDKQKTMFKPLFDALTTTIDPITGLKTETNMASILNQMSKQLEELPGKQAESMLALAKQRPETRSNLPIGISEKELNKFLKHANTEENPFTLKQIDLNQAVFPAQDNLGIDPDDSYFELTPRNEEIRTHILLIKDQVTTKTWDLTEALWIVSMTDTIEVSDFAKSQYMEMIDFMLGDHIRTQLQIINNEEEGAPNWSVDALKLFQQWYRKSKTNGKFRTWIVPAYQIPSEEELETMIKSALETHGDIDDSHHSSVRESSDRESSDSDSESEIPENLAEAIDKGHVETDRRKVDLPTTPEKKPITTQPKSASKTIKEEIDEKIDVPKKDGDGLKEKKKKVRPPKYIIISPNSEERFQRLNVLLGSKKAGNNVGLDEFNSILDSLLKDEKIKKKDCSRFMKAWNYLEK